MNNNIYNNDLMLDDVIIITATFSIYPDVIDGTPSELYHELKNELLPEYWTVYIPPSNFILGDDYLKIYADYLIKKGVEKE